MDPEIVLGIDPTAEEKVVFLAYLFSNLSLESLTRLANHGVRLWLPEDVGPFIEETFLNIERAVPGRVERSNAFEMMKTHSQETWKNVLDAATKAKSVHVGLSILIRLR